MEAISKSQQIFYASYIRYIIIQDFTKSKYIFEQQKMISWFIQGMVFLQDLGKNWYFSHIFFLMYRKSANCVHMLVKSFHIGPVFLGAHIWSFHLRVKLARERGCSKSVSLVGVYSSLIFLCGSAPERGCLKKRMGFKVLKIE